MTNTQQINIEAIVNAPIEKVWKAWSNPNDIMQWNFADPSWHSPACENDLREGGKFKYRMEARDGSYGFDFEGVYDTVVPHHEIFYTMPDGRKVFNYFESEGDQTKIKTIFDAENENDSELQRQGWQSILNNFKKYVESI